MSDIEGLIAAAVCDLSAATMKAIDDGPNYRGEMADSILRRHFAPLFARQQERIGELEELARELDSYTDHRINCPITNGRRGCGCGLIELEQRARRALSPRTEAENG